MKTKSFFTIVELLVVFGILLILVSLLQPAMSKIIGNAQSLECLNKQRLISTAYAIYSEENNDEMVSLAVRGNPGSDALVKSSYATWWPDLLRQYLNGLDSVTCTSVTKYGIGINHPELANWLSKGYNLNTVRSPSKTVLFGDSSRIENPTEQNADLWLPFDPEKSAFFFRVPSNAPFYTTLPTRVYGRHLGKANVVHVDGHAELTYVSELGFQYPKNHSQAYWDR